MQCSLTLKIKKFIPGNCLYIFFSFGYYYEKFLFLPIFYNNMPKSVQLYFIPSH